MWICLSTSTLLHTKYWLFLKICSLYWLSPEIYQKHNIFHLSIKVLKIEIHYRILSSWDNFIDTLTFIQAFVIIDNFHTIKKYHFKSIFPICPFVLKENLFWLGWVRGLSFQSGVQSQSRSISTILGLGGPICRSRWHHLARVTEGF